MNFNGIFLLQIPFNAIIAIIVLHGFANMNLYKFGYY